MKKPFLVFLVIMILMVTPMPIAAYNTNVLLSNNNQILNFPALIINGHTLVPARSIFETIGASVAWEATTKSININYNDSYIDLQVNCDQPTINGTIQKIDAPAQIINGKTYVPLRFVGNAIGYYIDWDNDTTTSFISKTPEELLYLKTSDENTKTLYTKTGIASWYGGGEALSKHTASGEIFNPKEMTAAHRELPFGTHVKVTLLETGKSTIVRINDRGPNINIHPDRVIDLSRAAAQEIGLTGIGEVKLEILKN